MCATTLQEIRQPSLAQKPLKTFADITGNTLVVSRGKLVETYDIAELPTPWEGRAFDLTKKSTGERYQVFVAANGQDHLCDCMGFTAHATCKHTASLLAMWEAGRLPVPEALAPVEIHDPETNDYRRVCAECGQTLNEGETHPRCIDPDKVYDVGAADRCGQWFEDEYETGEEPMPF
jgi:hypothetical protein